MFVGEFFAIGFFFTFGAIFCFEGILFIFGLLFDSDNLSLFVVLSFLVTLVIFIVWSTEDNRRATRLLEGENVWRTKHNIYVEKKGIVVGTVDMAFVDLHDSSFCIESSLDYTYWGYTNKKPKYNVIKCPEEWTKGEQDVCR